MSSDRNGFFGFMCLVTGAALGAGLALLFAPQTGEETRKKIKDVSGKMAEDVKDSYDKLGKEAKKSIDQIKNTAETAMQHLKSFIDGTKEGLKKEIKAEIKEETEPKTPSKKKA